MCKRTFLFTLALCLTFLRVAAQNSDAGLYIDPATIDFNLLNGQASTATITITNKLAITKQFNLYLNDWQRDTMGKHVYRQPGSNNRSCAQWISLDKPFVELKPGESTVVNVRMAVPDSLDAVKQMRWAMLFVESIEEQKVPGKVEGVSTSIRSRFRIGVHVYQTPPTKVNKEVRMLAFAPLPNSADSVYRLECANTGDTQLRCVGTLELESLANGAKTTLKPVPFPLFPEQRRYLDFVIPKTLAKGRYTVVATIDAGEDMPLEAAQKVIEVN